MYGSAMYVDYLDIHERGQEQYVCTLYVFDIPHTIGIIAELESKCSFETFWMVNPPFHGSKPSKPSGHLGST
jgi:hypothetical protein